jgi:hypothetical protein
MRQRLNDLRHRLAHGTCGKVVHEGHHYVHLVYFAAVAVEGHGVYSMAGGALLIIGVVAILIGDTTDVDAA